MLERLLPQIEIVSQHKNDSCNTYALTGTLDSITRSEAIDLITTKGEQYSATVARRVTHLVVGKDPSQAKLDKAKSLNITILNEKEFLNIINAT